MLPDVTIVIVTYGSQACLGECVHAILQSTTARWEAFIIDNASPDDTPSRIRNLAGLHPNLRPILNATNVGYARAANVGIHRAQAPVTILLNPDTLVTPGWERPLITALADEQTGLVGPVSNVGFVEQVRDLFANGFGRYSLAQAAAAVSRFQGNYRSVERLQGFCLAFRTELLRSVGGLDPRFIIGGDDLDISWRMRSAGFQLLVADGSFVAHQGSKSMGLIPDWWRQALNQRTAFYLREGAATGLTPRALWGITYPDNWDNWPRSLERRIVTLPEDWDHALDCLARCCEGTPPEQALEITTIATFATSTWWHLQRFPGVTRLALSRR